MSKDIVKNIVENIYNDQFNSLKEDEIKKIVEIELNKLTKRLSEIKLNFKFDNKLVSHIAKVGFDETYGARPIKRAIQDQIEDLVSEEVLNGTVLEEKQYSLSVKGDKVVIK